MKLNKLKLNEISKNNLTHKEMKMVVGGTSCTCSCYWEGRGGSNVEDNCNANVSVGSEGGYSEYGTTKMWCIKP